MPRSIVVAVAVVAALGTQACQRPGPGALDSAAQFAAQDEATVREMFTSTPGFFRAADWAGWTALWSEDGFFQIPNQPTVRGRPALQAWAQTLPPVEEVSFGDIQVQGEGNIAVGTSSYVLKLKGEPADSGKQLVVFRRSPGAKWEVIAASYNSDLPASGARAAAGAARR